MNDRYIFLLKLPNKKYFNVSIVAGNYQLAVKALKAKGYTEEQVIQCDLAYRWCNVVL